MGKRHRLRWLVPALCGLALPAAPGCTRATAPVADWRPDSEPVHPLAGYEGYFWITWNGARIGDARESLRQRGDELRFERRERLSVRRGDALVHSETAISIVTDRDLVAREISIWQISGDSEARGRAHRDDGAWVASYDGEPARRLPADAVPAELVPLLIASREHADTPGDAVDPGHADDPGDADGPDDADDPDVPAPGDRVFDGPVILAGYGFATGQLSVEAGDDHSLLADLRTPHGVMRGRYLLQRNGTVARVIGADGVSATRVARDDLATPFEPPELVESTSVPVHAADEDEDYDAMAPRAEAAGSDLGVLARYADERVVLRVSPVDRPPPPSLPGQRIEQRDDAWHVTLLPGDDGVVVVTDEPARQPADPAMVELAGRIVADSEARGPRAEVVALARATADLIEDDLSSGASTGRAALAAGRGDCTAHSALFASLARARRIPVRLVTGYRLDGDQLVRHRWAIAAVGRTWMAVDPTYGEAPASPRLLGLAVHQGGYADMAVVDDMAFAGLVGASALRLR